MKEICLIFVKAIPLRATSVGLFVCYVFGRCLSEAVYCLIVTSIGSIEHLFLCITYMSK